MKQRKQSSSFQVISRRENKMLFSKSLYFFIIIFLIEFNTVRKSYHQGVSVCVLQQTQIFPMVIKS